MVISNDKLQNILNYLFLPHRSIVCKCDIPVAISTTLCDQGANYDVITFCYSYCYLGNTTPTENEIKDSSTVVLGETPATNQHQSPMVIAIINCSAEDSTSGPTPPSNQSTASDPSSLVAVSTASGEDKAVKTGLATCTCIPETIEEGDETQLETAEEREEATVSQTGLGNKADNEENGGGTQDPVQEMAQATESIFILPHKLIAEAIASAAQLLKAEIETPDEQQDQIGPEDDTAGKEDESQDSDRIQEVAQAIESTFVLPSTIIAETLASVGELLKEELMKQDQSKDVHQLEESNAEQDESNQLQVTDSDHEAVAIDERVAELEEPLVKEGEVEKPALSVENTAEGRLRGGEGGQHKEGQVHRPIGEETAERPVMMF